MNKYKYIFIDAQILLTTGVFAISSSSPEGKIQMNDLLRMFILSTFKIIREIGCDRPFLVWDSSPYHKNDILKKLLGKDDYKSDRGYKNDSDIVNIKAQICDTLDKIESLKAEDPILHDAQIAELTEQVEKWRKEIKNIEVSIHNFKVRSDTKYFIIKELQKFGITSIIKKGYECDDICTLLANWCEEHQERALLVSKDSDYDYMLNPYVDRYNHLCKKAPTSEDPNPKFKTYDQMLEYYWWIKRDFPDKRLHEVKALMDSAWGSHNFLHKTVKPEWCKDGIFLIDALNHGEDAFSDYNLFKIQLETFNFSNYPDYEFIKNCLPWYMTKGELGSFSSFCDFISKNNIKMNPNGYRTILSILDYSLYN